MIKATYDEVRSAYTALSRIFEETKLGADGTWRVSRMLTAMKKHVKDISKYDAKLYRDAGGIVSSGGRVSMPTLPGQQPNESLADYEKRYEAYREKINKLSDDLDVKAEAMLEFELMPIPVTMLPKKRKNDKGEEENVEYRATDFSECGPFLVEKEEESK